MKKTTKKLISTLLALVMMLTIIPMGTMTAMAYDSYDLCECGHTYRSHVADPGFSCLSCDNGECTSGDFTLHKCSALEKKNGQAATCTKDGWKDYYKCTLSACNKMYASTDTTGTVITDLSTFRKSAEGKIPATGHKFVSYTSNNNATCIADGTKTATCANGCGVTDTITETNTKKGHSYTTKASSQKASDATCTTATTYYVQCDNCTAVDTTKTVSVGKSLGHSFTNYISNNDATCTVDGTKTATCDRNGCGVTDTITDEGTATGHSFTNYVSDKNATCTEDGTKTAVCDNKCGKKDTITDKGSATGHKYTSKVTKKATYTADGVRTYTCSNCGNKYTAAIPRLKATSAVKYNNSTKMNSTFKVSSSTKNVTVNWGKVANADGYMIYAGYCGKGDAKLIKTIKGEDVKSYSFTKLDGKKLDLTKNFKVYVVAYSNINGKKVEIGRTITGHVVGGKSKKYTNSTKITVKNSKVTLNVGKTSTIKATVTYKDPKKKPVGDSHAAEKRYRSSNKAVATVDANGKIKAVGKGTCTVYVFAKNGYAAKVTVTVK